MKVIARKGESADQLMRRFNRECQDAGVLRDMKRYQAYEKPSEKRRRKLLKAIANRRKAEKEKAKEEGRRT